MTEESGVRFTLRATKAGGARRFGLAFVFLRFLIGTIAHFAATETEVRLVPPYISWPYAAVWVSGVFELLDAGRLLFARTRRAAGIGLFVLTILVTPVHIYMLQSTELFDVPYWVLILRVPVLLALLALLALIVVSMFRRSIHAGYQ